MVGILNFWETYAFIISSVKGGVGSSGSPGSGASSMGSVPVSMHFTPSMLRGSSFQVNDLVPRMFFFSGFRG